MLAYLDGATWQWKLAGPEITSHTNWSRYSSTVVYLTSGYSSEASTPNDGSISKLVWSPLMKTEWLIDNITLSGKEASARNTGKHINLKIFVIIKTMFGFQKIWGKMQRKENREEKWKEKKKNKNKKMDSKSINYF